MSWPRIDAYLDDERFLAPWRGHFHARLGRPSVPVPTLLRLLYLKHRYQLGYESLCREVADSISWRRFCRIPLDQPVPHPTTLSKLVRRAGPQVIDQLNHALLGKLAADKLLRGREYVGFDFFPDAWGDLEGDARRGEGCLDVVSLLWVGYGMIACHDQPR
jgi:IS5 family transposase